MNAMKNMRIKMKKLRAANNFIYNFLIYDGFKPGVFLSDCVKALYPQFIARFCFLFVARVSRSLEDGGSRRSSRNVFIVITSYIFSKCFYFRSARVAVTEDGGGRGWGQQATVTKYSIIATCRIH